MAKRFFRNMLGIGEVAGAAEVMGPMGNRGDGALGGGRKESEGMRHFGASPREL